MIGGSDRLTGEARRDVPALVSGGQQVVVLARCSVLTIATPSPQRRGVLRCPSSHTARDSALPIWRTVQCRRLQLLTRSYRAPLARPGNQVQAWNVQA